MRADEIKAALQARAGDVCAHLLPAGQRNGDEFEVGSLGGEPGHSLKVNLNGKTGVWKDFAAGDGGDNLLELWSRVRGCDIRQAMREAAEFLGLPARKPERDTHTARTLLPADAPTGHPKWRSKLAGVWCYGDADGVPWLLVYRYDTQDGKAFFTFDHKAQKWIEKNGHQLPERRPPYRLHQIASAQPGLIVLTEGEKCADALARLGIQATTTLGGCGQIKYADLSALKGWRVVIWRDADEPGRQYAETATAMLRTVGAAEVLLVPVPVGVADKWDVVDAIRDGWTADDLRAQIAMAEPIGDPIETPAESTGRFRLLTDEDLERQPNLPDLVKDTFPAASLIVIAGQPSTCKTTLGIELAGDVGCDLLFHGRPVTAGPVVFVAAEGGSKLGLRVRAWKHWRKVPKLTNIRFIAEPVHFGDAFEVDALLVALQKLPSPPVLVVVDTLARCMIGADENSARDVGDFVNGCDRIRQATGAAVLIVHHTTKGGGAERGSGALRGAADTLVMLSREDDLITVSCEKQKDSAPFEPLHFRLRVIELGNERTACVLDPADEPDGATAEIPEPGSLPDSRKKVLDVLRDAPCGATFATWQRIAQATHRISESTFQRAVKDLEKWGYVRRKGKLYLVEREQS